MHWVVAMQTAELCEGVVVLWGSIIFASGSYLNPRRERYGPAFERDPIIRFARFSATLGSIVLLIEGVRTILAAIRG